jgi:hypothetical protein
MFLASGDVHECDFVNGRAHGDGTYVSAKGIESIGEMRPVYVGSVWASSDATSGNPMFHLRQMGQQPPHRHI